MTDTTGLLTDDALRALADAFDVDRAMAAIEALSAPVFSGRGVGTAGHDLARDWVVRKLRGLGADPETHHFSIEETFRVDAEPSVVVDNERPLDHRVDFAEHPCSATMSAPVEGVAVPLGTEPRPGAWVVLDALPQGDAFAELARAVDEAGGVGLLTPQNPDGSGFLTKRTIGPPPVSVPVVAVRADLLAELAGKSVRAFVPIHRGPATGANIVAEILPGQLPPVLLTAHYDGVGSDPGRQFPCAGDNASGVAVLCEVARALRGNATGLGRQVVVAILDAEEIGALGSRHHAGKLSSADVVNLDMAGKLDAAVAVEASGNAGPIIQALDRAGRILRIPLSGGAVASDNRQYAAAGFPAVGLGLGAAHYHSPLDTVDRIEPDTVRKAGRLLTLTTAFLATRSGENDQNTVKE